MHRSIARLLFRKVDRWWFLQPARLRFDTIRILCGHRSRRGCFLQHTRKRVLHLNLQAITNDPSSRISRNKRRHHSLHRRRPQWRQPTKHLRLGRRLGGSRRLQLQRLSVCKSHGQQRSHLGRLFLQWQYGYRSALCYRRSEPCVAEHGGEF